MSRAAAALLGLGLALAPGDRAAAERLTVSLSSHRLQIESNFTGAQIVLFGVIERDAQSVGRPGGFDVVITARGPRETLTVRRKEELGPVWINRAQQKFVGVPSFLGVYASRPLDDITNPVLRGRLRLGIDAIVAAPDFTAERGAADDPFRKALLRLKRRDGLWSENQAGVSFVTGEVFRAPLPLPGTAPTGSYEVDLVVLSQGVVVARGATTFDVVKAGFEDQVTDFARDRSLPYGLAIAAMAVMFGWIANAIFRRD